jgi:amidase
MNSPTITDQSRRRFLGQAGAVGAGVALLSLAPQRAKAQNQRGTFLSSSDSETNLTYMSATKLASMIREKKVSAREVVEAHIARINAVNPLINAVVMRSFDRARIEASEADSLLSRGVIKGPLHGVPMAIKDSIDTEGVITTGGTIGRKNYIPEKDATAVARLRAAGAILLGKTNTPEFTLAGGGIPGVSTTGNIIYGISRNPYDTSRSTAGSSGGAGAIVAAGGAPFDVGTDWGGSVRGPAHNCGIVGLKPTIGCIPRTGHIVDYGGIFDNWQQFGPMTRKVEDINLLTPIMAGPDFKDALIPPIPWKDPFKVNLPQLKVAFFTTNKVAPTSPETKAVVRNTASVFAEMGCAVTEDLPEEIINRLNHYRSLMMTADAWSGLQRLADKWGSNTVSTTIANRLRGEVKPSDKLTYYMEEHDRAKSDFLKWFSKYDLIVCPAANDPAGEINMGGSGAWTPGASYYGMFNSTGWPAIVLRAGTSPEGLPIGVQLVSHAWRDDVCVAAAGLIESAFGGWKAPNI